MMIYLIGSGGAGKTTTAQLLASQLGWDCFDLDLYFMQTVSDISTYIDQFGYAYYAQKNIECYLTIMHKVHQQGSNVIVVCSSGFMTYPEDIHLNYLELKKQILEHSLTFILLPSLSFEICVQEIVKRQMNRPYLKASAEKERDKIIQRFHIYSQLPCQIMLTDVQPLEVVNNIKNNLNQ